jgi:PEP-CTERM motif
MKTTLLCVSAAGLLAAVAQAQNENVTWQLPTTISGTSDVSTLGLYFGSWAPQNGSANTLPVNGVTFQGFSDLPDLTPGSTLDNGYNGFASPGTADNNYNALLQFGRFSNETTPATFSWGGMTPGDTYLVELWVNDGRNSTVNQRTETVTGGDSTSGALAYGSDDTGAGQFIIGTFLADSSGSETLTLTPGSAFPSAQINLFQVRDISVVPEPSTLGLLASGAGAMIWGFRRKSRAE